MYLNCHSRSSHRYGVLDEAQILDFAARHGLRRIAVTDVNNTSACLNTLRLGAHYGIDPVVGVDVRRGAEQRFVALARTNEGYARINDLLARIRGGEPVPRRAPEMDGTVILYPFRQAPDASTRLRANEYVAVGPHDLNRLRRSPWRAHPEKLVASAPMTVRSKRDHNVHRLLRAIDRNVLLSKLPPHEQCPPTDRYMAPRDWLTAFAGWEPLVRNARTVIESCHVHFDFGPDRPPQTPRTFTGSAYDDAEMIRQLCRDGLANRYGDAVSDAVKDRLHTELDVIQRMGFTSYFLINHDIVRYARRNDYFYVGRGSGANSIVAYLLRITDVDPIELDLYFERFINLYRTNPPDFDIDFSWRDRDDVTRYIFDRFEHTALLGAYVTFQERAAVRELGKVFGLPKHEIDELSEGRRSPDADRDHLHRLVLRAARAIHGLPSHTSVHSAGILIADGPLHRFASTFVPPKGFPTTDFDMLIAEDVGLHKFDILGQRGLAKIKDCLQIVRTNRPEAPPIDIHDVARFKRDPQVNDMVRRAECIGCFYVESPAMRGLLRKLQVDDYLGLVAASSIIRPGVSQSGMMREYIVRQRDPARRADAHPVMRSIMPDTFGIMVYQEDVIKVAHHFAGLTLGEADVLRRGMSGKYRSRAEFDRVRDTFFQNCRAKGHADELAREVWRQIESFAGYAFAKGHSASYAVESYQSLFLKTYYPLEYMTAILNNGGGFYRREVYVHEARMLGATIEPPCVNTGGVACTIEGSTIRLGLGLLKGLDDAVARAIVGERARTGPYTGLADLVERVPMGIEAASILIRIGALRFTGRTKRHLLWEAHTVLAGTKRRTAQARLFRPAASSGHLPDLPAHPLEDAFDEIELLGFALCDPFDLLREPPDDALRARHLPGLVGQHVVLYGYLVARKRTRTRTGDEMCFGTFLDRDGHFVDTVHFPPSVQAWPFRGVAVYRLEGRVTEEFDFRSIEVSRMERMEMVEDVRYAVS